MEVALFALRPSVLEAKIKSLIKRLVVELYHNPFECCKQTAQIICKISKKPCIEDCALCEWASNELESNVLEHILTALST